MKDITQEVTHKFKVPEGDKVKLRAIKIDDSSVLEWKMPSLNIDGFFLPRKLREEDEEKLAKMHNFEEDPTLLALV